MAVSIALRNAALRMLTDDDPPIRETARRLPAENEGGLVLLSSNPNP